MKTTLEIDGYTATIEQDQTPENPFTMWDGEPPIVVFHDRSLYAYGSLEPSLTAIVRLLPGSVFERGKRVAFIREHLNCTLREFAEAMRDEFGGVRDTFAGLMEEAYGDPRGWNGATAWMETAEYLLKSAGVPCAQVQSNGYSQGHSALVLAVATPEWCKSTGCEGEHRQQACDHACKLYGWWAWGDVYGVSAITAPDGEELEDADCWGFFGDDHEESGLAEHVRECVRHHKEQVMRASLHAANVRFFGSTSLTPV